jgi:hypothetical protein
MATDPAPARRDYPGRWPWQLARSRRPAYLALLALLGAGLAAYAYVLAGTAPFSRGALIGVIIPGAVLGTIALVRPPQRISPPEELDLTGMSYWVICLAAFFEWEASAYRDNSWPWHPSFTDLIEPLMEPHLIKSAAILVWLLAGWALVRR